MEHARKMILVPAEEIPVTPASTDRVSSGDSYEPMVGAGRRVKGDSAYAVAENDQKSVQTPGDPASRLDTELQGILHSKKYHDDAEKWKQYLQVLQRYLFLVDTRSVPMDKPMPFTPGAAETATIREKKDEILPVETVIASVPLKYRPKAIGLLQFLYTSASAAQRIRWDGEGRVTIDGVSLPGSNIVDLINDAVRHREHFRAAGRAPFIRTLRENSVPQEYVGNKRLWTVGAASLRGKRLRKNPDKSGKSSMYYNDDDNDDNEDEDDDSEDPANPLGHRGTSMDISGITRLRNKRRDDDTTRPHKRRMLRHHRIPLGINNWLKL